MAESTVNSAGGHIHLEADGTYTLRFWYRLRFGKMQEEIYEGLNWGEAQDALSAELDGHRPGWVVGFDWMQPDLLSELHGADGPDLDELS